MNDLEYAAKAAGIDGQLEGDGWFINNADGLQWNPEEDEGDSRRLQVKLRIDIGITDNELMGCLVTALNYERQIIDCQTFDPAIEGDDLRAVRKAVLAVAVQIGKEMK